MLIHQTVSTPAHNLNHTFSTFIIERNFTKIKMSNSTTINKKRERIMLVLSIFVVLAERGVYYSIRSWRCYIANCSSY